MNLEIACLESAEPEPEPPSNFCQCNRVEEKLIHFYPTHQKQLSFSAPKNRIKLFYKKYFNETDSACINDWKWQMKNRVTQLSELKNILQLSDDELKSFDAEGRQLLPMSITPYYLSLFNSEDEKNPLRLSMVPTYKEFHHGKGEAEDPLGEEKYSPVPGIVHRYPDRVLFLISDICAAYCRYCTRSRLVGGHGDHHTNKSHWAQGIQYIKSHPEIRDVLLSGGDPLCLGDEVLESVIREIRAIPHVEIIRIGTKAPVVLPQRITPALCKMLKKYHPLMISIHFTHPMELTKETNRACNRLADAGIPLGSQTVLLAGINDDAETMKKLMHGLLKIRVRPYYIFQCDPILGSEHLRVPVSKGLEIIKQLRGFTSGYAVPTYVIDAPKGGGKIPLLPDYYVGRENDEIILKNYLGDLYRYPDTASCQDSK